MIRQELYCLLDFGWWSMLILFLSQLRNLEQESNISKKNMKQVGLFILIKKVKIHQNAEVWY